MRQVVQDFYVSSTKARFGIIQYADSAQIDLTFSQSVSNVAVQSAINNINYRGSSSSNNLASAFDLVATTLFSQSSPNTAKVC